MKISLDEIIFGCSRNERKYQEILYKLYSQELMYTVRKYIKDPMFQEEVLHNGFLSIYKNIDKFSFQGSFDGWMKKIMVRKSLDWIKSNKRYSESTIFSEEMPEKIDDVTPLSIMGYKRIQKLISELPGRCKEVFTSYHQGINHIEIGKNLGISPNTSKWYLSEARKMLQKRVKEYK